ncbi:homoserine dehydrogenase [Pradoshia sp. D12]|nr:MULTISPECIES: homoserine dehydrogenase [Bacillaceae]QFK72689.1 homoserine dehydrogenase [Pradoshia sp. D12]TPF71683.1 homoserine dehydrogenase [Bacillus sp. D12]
MSSIHKQMYFCGRQKGGDRVKPITIGLLGLGTVGTGVVQIIQNHQEKLMHQVGCPVEIKRILVKDKYKDRAMDVSSELITTSATDIISDPEIDIVIEVIGGVEDTYLLLMQALNNKKHIVTANKDLMAVYGPDLLRTASENGCDLFYEASVAGGIPILRSLVDGLASDHITKIMGIVNGTTNYIMTKMTKEKVSYQEALKEAQDLGFAEADPTADVEGLDAARKMAILATLGFSMNIGLEDVKVQGITTVSDADLALCKRLGYTMKLLGFANRTENKVEVSVQPTLLPEEHPLATVNDEYNAVYVYGEAVGETMFYGPGAGSLPTATAVVSDLVAIMKNMRLDVNGRSAVIPQFDKKLKTNEEINSKFFLRIHVKDEVGVFAQLTAIFANHGISFEKIMQLPIKVNELSEIVLVSHKAPVANFENVLRELETNEKVYSIKSTYRVEGGA